MESDLGKVYPFSNKQMHICIQIKKTSDNSVLC